MPVRREAQQTSLDPRRPGDRPGSGAAEEATVESTRCGAGCTESQPDSFRRLQAYATLVVLALSGAVLEPGPLAPPTSPSFFAPPGLSVTQDGPAWPSRVAGSPHAKRPLGFNVLLTLSFSLHAVAITRWHLWLGRSSSARGLRSSPNPTRVGSHATRLRPARRSLSFRPARSPSRPRRHSTPEATMALFRPPDLRLLPAGSTS
jgi:hypothetical protein